MVLKEIEILKTEMVDLKESSTELNQKMQERNYVEMQSM